MLDEVKSIVSLLMKRPITEAIAIQVKSIPGYEHLEIEAGEWIGFDATEDSMTTGEEHGWIEALLVHFLTGHVLAHKLGRVYPGDVTFVLEGQPDGLRRSREPDVSFVTASNVTPTSGFIYGAPDLAVEIISPSQSYDEIFTKVEEYFHAGAKQVWLVLPGQRRIEVHTPDGRVVKYGTSDVLVSGDLLPGFSLKVADIFET